MIHVLAATTMVLVLDGTNPVSALPPPKHGGVYVVAHRGAHDGIPENTLAAYERAIELGADFVEIDVRTTKDGHLVSIHNSTVDAYVTDGTQGRVSDMTLAELRALDIGSRVGPEWAGAKVPTVEEILALCQGRIGLYLDVKDAALEPLVALVNQYGMASRSLWYIDSGQVASLRQLCAACIPMPDPGPETHLAALLDETKPPVVAAVWRFFSPTFVAACHEAGALVIVDEQDASSWPEALAWGADGIQTDDPEGLIAYLTEARLPVGP